MTDRTILALMIAPVVLFAVGGLIRMGYRLYDSLADRPDFKPSARPLHPIIAQGLGVDTGKPHPDA